MPFLVRKSRTLASDGEGNDERATPEKTATATQKNTNILAIW